MDILDNDLINFWKSLNQYDVKYIMVGGFAVNLHGFSRTTGDLDIWLKNESSNKKKLGKALVQFGYDELSFEDVDFVPGWTDFYIGSGVRLDIVTEMAGLENISFDDALKRANVARLFDVNVPSLHINQHKEQESHQLPKDIIDVPELKKIIKIRG